MDDRDIIALFNARSEDAIEAVRRKYGAYCHTVAGNILRSPEDAEECLSDTWLKAWSTIPPAQPTNLGAYLAKICRNTALSIWERRNAQKRGGEVSIAIDELELCVPCSEDALKKILLGDLLERFLASMKPEARRIFILRYWHVYSVKEIAARLSVGESRVKMSLLRSRRALSQMLEREGIDI